MRLKGYEWSLKRSGFAKPESQPKYIEYLETLNVFGIQADFMKKFKDFLQKEELPSNNQKITYTLPLNITYDFGKQLKVLRPRRKDSNGNEYAFKNDAKIPTFGDIPDKLIDELIVIDWYPRIQSFESTVNRKEAN